MYDDRAISKSLEHRKNHQCINWKMDVLKNHQNSYQCSMLTRLSKNFKCVNECLEFTWLNLNVSCKNFTFTKDKSRILAYIFYYRFLEHPVDYLSARHCKCHEWWRVNFNQLQFITKIRTDMLNGICLKSIYSLHLLSVQL